MGLGYPTFGFEMIGPSQVDRFHIMSNCRRKPLVWPESSSVKSTRRFVRESLEAAFSWVSYRWFAKRIGLVIG